ncbi:MAG: CcmD family protein [Chloroflexi bacterium]|jgi:CcmD family protein|nr:CcmD family protein [Chloroflexota bacterium]MBT4074277.1 CcmD family protein [Chloroflexota bacterium]MBT4513479.1 CcmD family protein [Chloroflexota bacterium]MBT5319926.1 CcmD family protein [Chloroflexota bacterium]MBT6680963.1 CcmD family protein [Chloroflexota bacterium]
MRNFFVLAFVALTALALPSVAMAQSAATSAASDGNTSGVITVIQVDSETNLVGFVLSTQNGELVEVSVNDSTSFGLENAAGDRWVSDFGEDPTEALLRITDQRERFAPVTVTVADGVASAVVDREQGDLERNLGFLFAIYIVTWAGFFAYIFIVSRRQSDLAREIKALTSQVG